MAKGVPLTVQQVATVTRVWLATTNASEAAREAGCSERSARKYIIAANLPNAPELYARALEREERLHLAAVRKARRKVREALLSAGTDADAVSKLTRAATDGLRSVNATRIAHLKASGLGAPDKVDVTSGGDKIGRVVVLPALEPAPASALPAGTTGADAGALAVLAGSNAEAD